jgi:CHAD domain-containing protein
MADGKWITDVTAMTPLVDAARRVLTVRLEVVHDYLPLALHKWTEDPEHVHQLRVGTRRAGAAIEIFQSSLPPQSYKKIRRCLRKLRRAAGAARDWDVFAEALSERESQSTAVQRQGLDFLIGYAHGQRVAAQDALTEASPDAPFDFEALVVDTLASLQDASNGRKSTMIHIARPGLSELLGEFHEAATGDLQPYENLHKVRIIGKRLRYSMEIFAECFNRDFKDEYYPMVEEMQDILGRANDSHVATGRLEFLRDLLKDSRPAAWKRFRAGIDATLRYHQRRLPRERRLFLAWWGRWQKSGAEEELTGLVARPA